MKFIEIEEGVSISVRDIVAIQRKDESYSVVLMRNGHTFESTFPYKTLLELVEMNHSANEMKLQTVLESMKPDQRTSQFIAV